MLNLLAAIEDEGGASGVGPSPIDTESGAATLKGLEALFGNVIQAALGLAGIALFVMLLVGGFRFITAGDDPKAVEGAKKTLTYAIIGVVLVALSFLIIRFISDFTGVNVTEFQIYQNN